MSGKAIFCQLYVPVHLIYIWVSTYFMSYEGTDSLPIKVPWYIRTLLFLVSDLRGAGHCLVKIPLRGSRIEVRWAGKECLVEMWCV